MGRRDEKPEFHRLGDLLPRSAPLDPLPAPGPGDGPIGGGEGDPSQRLAAVWGDAVGPDVACNARPVQLRSGRLVVTTSSTAWAQTLQMMSEMVIARLNEQLGQGTVEKAVFRHAGWDPLLSTAGSEAAASPRERVEARAQPTDSRSGAAAKQTPRPRRKASGPPAVAGAVPTEDAAEDVCAGFTEEQRQALADLERLPLAAPVKRAMRDAMIAGFVRARQDFGRS